MAPRSRPSDDLLALPGGDLVEASLRDIEAGRDTVEALLVLGGQASQVALAAFGERSTGRRWGRIGSFPDARPR